MQDLTNLNTTEITQPQVLTEIEKEVEKIVRFCREEEARKLSKQLRTVLQRKDLNIDKEVLDKLKRWYSLVSYISLPAHTDEVVLSLFQNYFVDALILDDEILTSRLRSLLWVQLLGIREEFCEKLIQALKDNKQPLGELTVGEWIATFVHSYPGRIQLLRFEERDFINKNERAQKLSSQDKKKLAKLLKIYDALRPFEVRAQFFRQPAPAEGLSEEERKQRRLGEAMGRVAEERGREEAFKGYQGPRDLRDIKPKEGARVPPSRETPAPEEAYPSSAPEAPASKAEPPRAPQQIRTTQEIKPGPPETSMQVEARPVPAPTRATTRRGRPRRVARSVAPTSSKQAVSLPKPKSVSKSELQKTSPPKKELSPAARKEIDAGSLTIADLEKAAQSQDGVSENRIRKIIRQDFNRLSKEVRGYVLNSPFWAE